MRQFRGVIKNRNFVALWISQALSQAAIHCLNFLVILKVFDYTGSTIATSLVWVAFVLPAILIGPFAATIVDYMDKRKVLMVTNLAQAMIMIFYSFSDQGMVYLSYMVVLLYSVFNQFYIPAELSCLPLLVQKKRLPQANGLFLITYQAALVVGFGLAGVVGDVLGAEKAFWLAGGMVMLAFASVMTLPRGDLKQVGGALRWGEFGQVLSETVRGFVYIYNKRVVFLPFIAIVGLQVFLPVLVVNLPIISRDILGINPYYAGLAVATPAGVGAALGIGLVSRYLAQMRKKIVIKRSLTGMVLTFWAAMLVVPLIPMPYRLLVSTALFLALGVSYIGVFISAQTLLQVSTSKEMMARVFGNSWFVTSAATILPMMFSATIVELFGIRMMIAVMGLVILGFRFYFDRVAEGRIYV